MEQIRFSFIREIYFILTSLQLYSLEMVIEFNLISYGDEWSYNASDQVHREYRQLRTFFLLSHTTINLHNHKIQIQMNTNSFALSNQQQEHTASSFDFNKGFNDAEYEQFANEILIDPNANVTFFDF